MIIARPTLTEPQAAIREMKGNERESEMQARCFGATDVDRASPSLTAFTVREVDDGSTGRLFTAFALRKTSIALGRATLRTLGS